MGISLQYDRIFETRILLRIWNISFIHKQIAFPHKLWSVDDVYLFTSVVWANNDDRNENACVEQKCSLLQRYISYSIENTTFIQLFLRWVKRETTQCMQFSCLHAQPVLHLIALLCAIMNIVANFINCHPVAYNVRLVSVTSIKYLTI